MESIGLPVSWGIPAVANFLFGSFLISAEHVHAARKAHEQILKQGLSHQIEGTLMLESSYVATSWVNLDRLKARHAEQAAAARVAEPAHPW